MVRKSARFLAPIALAAVAVGVYLVVHANVAQHAAGTTISTTSSLVDGRHRGGHRGRRPPKFYVVRAGDTLSGISSRLGVSTATLVQLNPRLRSAPNSLATGQRLRLRR